MSESAAARHQRARNLALLSNPALWPAWPFLPVVRRQKGKEEYGLMCDLLRLSGLAGYRATVFANLFLLPPSLDDFVALPREVFDTPEEIYDAGWRVD